MSSAFGLNIPYTWFLFSELLLQSQNILLVYLI